MGRRLLVENEFFVTNPLKFYRIVIRLTDPFEEFN